MRGKKGREVEREAGGGGGEQTGQSEKVSITSTRTTNCPTNTGINRQKEDGCVCVCWG